MQEKLSALAELATLDGSVRESRLELEEIPKKVQESQNDLASLESLLGKERQDLADAQHLRQVQDQEISERQEQLTKTKMKSNQARNAREADAVDNEAQVIRRMIKEKEDERARLDTAIVTVSESVGKHEDEFSKLRGLIDQELAKAKTREKELTDEIASVSEGRDDLLGRLGKGLAYRYESIRKKYGSAVAWVVDGTCSGCRMAVPAQQYNLILRGESLEECRSCMRMLLLPPESRPEEDEA